MTVGEDTPKIKNTTAKINGTAGEIELTKGDEGTFTDVISIDNYGDDYTVECTLYKDGTEFDTASVKAGSAEVTVTFSKKITEAGEYAVKSVLMKSGETVGETHNANLDIASESVKVTVKEEESTSEEETTTDDDSDSSGSDEGSAGDDDESVNDSSSGKSNSSSSSKTTHTKGVKTGDAVVIEVFVAVLLAAMAAVASMIIRRKKIN